MKRTEEQLQKTKRELAEKSMQFDYSSLTSPTINSPLTSPGSWPLIPRRPESCSTPSKTRTFWHASGMDDSLARGHVLRYPTVPCVASRARTAVGSTSRTPTRRRPSGCAPIAGTNGSSRSPAGFCPWRSRFSRASLPRANSCSLSLGRDYSEHLFARPARIRRIFNDSINGFYVRG